MRSFTDKTSMHCLFRELGTSDSPNKSNEPAHLTKTGQGIQYFIRDPSKFGNISC